MFRQIFTQINSKKEDMYFRTVIEGPRVYFSWVRKHCLWHDKMPGNCDGTIKEGKQNDCFEFHLSGHDFAAWEKNCIQIGMYSKSQIEEVTTILCNNISWLFETIKRYEIRHLGVFISFLFCLFLFGLSTRIPHPFYFFWWSKRNNQ